MKDWNSMMTKDGWDPNQYAKFEKERSQPFFDLLKGVEERFGLESGNPLRVVDLGCGSGELTRVLHERLHASETLGLERSPAMLVKARALPPVASGVLRFEQGDLRSFHSSTPFDLIFSNAALHWCEDHPGLLKKLRESLSDSGWLAFQVPANQDYPTHRLANEMVRESRWADRFPEAGVAGEVLHPEEYARVLWSTGYRESTVRLEVYTHVFPDRSFVLEWVKGALLTAVKSELSDAEYQEFLEEYATRLFAKLPDDRPFLYPFKRILVWSRKQSLERN